MSEIEEYKDEGNNILAESDGKDNTAEWEPYDLAADMAAEVSGGGREALVGVISPSKFALEILSNEKHFHAFIDDSANLAGMCCAAGYLFEPPSAREFRRIWKPYLDSKGMKFFHATRDVRRPDAEEIFTKLATLIRQTASRGFVNFLMPDAMKSIGQHARQFAGSSFTASTLGCMNVLAKVAKEQNRKIVYFIEDSQEFGGELRFFLNQIKDDPEQKEDYAIAAADTFSKEDVIQLQAADLFAWSWTRSHMFGGFVPQLRELVQDKAVQHSMTSYDPAMMALMNLSNGIKSNRKRFD